MTPEERIEVLERQVEELRARFAAGVDIIQNIGGTNRMFQAAITGLIESHPDPEKMAASVHHHLERQYTSIHFEVLAESHVSSAQAAQQWLDATVQATLDRHRRQAEER